MHEKRGGTGRNRPGLCDVAPISGSAAGQTALAHAWQCLERGLFGAEPRSGSRAPPARHEAWALRARSWGGWGPGTSALVTGRGQKTSQSRAALASAWPGCHCLLPGNLLSGFVLVTLPHRAVTALSLGNRARHGWGALHHLVAGSFDPAAAPCCVFRRGCDVNSEKSNTYSNNVVR